MKAVLKDTIRIAINSVTEGLIDKAAAIGMIEDAIHNKCVDCKEKLQNDLSACLMTLERAVDEEMEKMLYEENEYPLDSLRLGEAERLYSQKDMVLVCEDGHVTGMFRERQTA